MKVLLTTLAVLVAALCSAGCRAPDPSKDDPRFDFSGRSKYALLQHARELTGDRNKTIKRFYEYHGDSVPRKQEYFNAARMVLLEARECYLELASRPRGKRDPDFRQLVFNTDETLRDLIKLDPKVEYDRRAAEERGAKIPGPPGRAKSPRLSRPRS